jgi:hypothetical protein
MATTPLIRIILWWSFGRSSIRNVAFNEDHHPLNSSDGETTFVVQEPQNHVAIVTVWFAWSEE